MYLGSLQTEDGKCETENNKIPGRRSTFSSSNIYLLYRENFRTSTRIELARSAFEKMSKVLTSRNINIQTRKRAPQCDIWSILLYGSETWTLTKATQNKLEAFEMWIYRRMMRISWD